MEHQKDEEVKNSIVDAARRVFQKWGFNKTIMEDIAHEAGKAKSTLYYYFKNKEEIFEAVSIFEIDSIIQKAKNSIKQDASAREKFKSYTSTMLLEIKKTVSIYPIGKGEVKLNREFIDKVNSQLNKKEEAIIKDIILYGIKSGEINFISRKELDKAAKVVSGIIRGLALYLFLDNDEPEIMDLAIRIISEGL
ncbi:MAG: helix-turn-helix domain-containing protein [Melioribacteraceae bacterium]